jgi:hypothetical protein
LFLLVENHVRYDKKRTTQSEESLKNSIKNAILLYNTTYLNKFGSTFILSKLQDSVDSVDTNSIIGSDCSLKIQKRFRPELGISKTYTVNYSTSLKRGTITDDLDSTQFDVFDSVGVRRTVQLEEVPNSFTGISEIQVTNGGTGYTSTPTVTITGDGSGATATAKVVNGRIESITINNRGIGYTRALVNITGGNGFGSEAIAIIDTKFGSLRTFYYDENANKRIVNESAGTIDYINGTIVLNNLRVQSVNSTDGEIRLTIESEKGIITSLRNTIITIDVNDPASIVTELTQA